MPTPITVGRIVHYHPTDAEEQRGLALGEQPCAAIVAHVLSESLVNLAVFASNGGMTNRTGVAFCDKENPKTDEPPDGAWCEYPPRA